ncbi:MAG: hypothetical protein ACRD21_02265 [Vicinamibacteria bacterium]
MTSFVPVALALAFAFSFAQGPPPPSRDGGPRGSYLVRGGAAVSVAGS